jgi:hypothetical protein
MNKRLLSLAVAGSMLLGLTGLAMAGIPDDVESTATSAGGVALITPAGLGVTLASAGATVSVTVRDANTDPIPGYPFQDIWLDDAGNGDIALCQGGSVADGNTDANGETTISGTIAGGGWTQSGAQVYLAGTPLAGPTLAIDFNSCDINGDLVVNVGDIGDFAIDFADPDFEFRSDFIPDGVINLADIGELALHNGEVCP